MSGHLVQNVSFETFLESIEGLSSEEKAQIISRLLATQAGVSVIFGNGANHVLKADLVVQINNSDADVIRTITDAIARRIER